MVKKWQCGREMAVQSAEKGGVRRWIVRLRIIAV